MLLVRNWYHCAWTTKDMAPLIVSEKKYDILTHMRIHAAERGLYIDIINGPPEHVHCIIFLRANQVLSSLVYYIKQESTAWINRKKVLPERFEWADEYIGTTVSPTDLEKTRDYIRKQDEYHIVRTWEEEREELLKEWSYIRPAD